MKRIHWLLVTLCTLLLVMVALNSRAYIGSRPSTYTNAVVDWPIGGANFLSVLTTNQFTRYTNAVLSFDFGFTNAPAGSIDVCYTMGPDWGMENSAASSPMRSWFAIPCTNSLLTTRVIFNTNLHLQSHGGIAILYITNNAGQTCTNIGYAAFTKSVVRIIQ